MINEGWPLECVLKSNNSSNFTRDAHWCPDHKTFFWVFSTMSVESDTPIFNLVRLA